MEPRNSPANPHVQSAKIAGIISITVAIISACANYHLARIKTLEEIKKVQQLNVYQIRNEAILQALNFLDLYCSWLTFDERVPIRESTTETKLTKAARKCYNRLCITCENQPLIDAFLDCVLGKKDTPSHVMELYNTFRNEARKELGLKGLNLDMDRVFISVVSTKDLSTLSARPAIQSDIQSRQFGGNQPEEINTQSLE